MWLDCREIAVRRIDSTSTSGWREPNAMENLKTEEGEKRCSHETRGNEE